MQGVRPSLTFREGAEEAVQLYVSLFKNSSIGTIVRSDGSGPIPAGQLWHISFKLDGQEYTAFDGGASFAFSEGFSMVATCDTQEEIDRLWAALVADGGEDGRCGWLKDRFGVSWQLVPADLGRMMSDPEHGNSAKVMESLLTMNKIDLAALRRAYEVAV